MNGGSLAIYAVAALVIIVGISQMLDPFYVDDNLLGMNLYRALVFFAIGGIAIVLERKGIFDRI